MAEFKPITTQEEFDAAIKDRIARNTKSVTEEVTKKFEGFISPQDIEAKTKNLTDKINTLTTQAAEKDKSIADLTAENKSMKLSALKSKIAHEKGLPFELASRLSGETEDDIGKDADALAKLVSASQPPAPLGSAEPVPESDAKAALMGVLGDLTK